MDVMDAQQTLDRDTSLRRRRFLDALYRRYSGMLVHFIRRQNIPSEEAKEIVQETYCRMHEVPQVETLESPRGYLFRTAINLARDNQRQRQRVFQQVAQNDPTQIAEIASEEPTAYRRLSAEQELAIATAAMSELSPACRRVFIMHRFENATYQEIATTLGLSVSMIEKHVSQALAHLKKRLDGAHRGTLPTRRVHRS